MPLVFVHGVATRQTPEYQAWVRQRDELFTKFVLPQKARVFDPDWGSNAVKLTKGSPWLPKKPGAGQPFALGEDAGAANTGIARLASKNPEAAVDLAFETALAVRAQAAASAGKPKDALTDDDMAAFEAAVRYLEAGPDKDVFDPDESDANFLSTLTDELKAHAPAKGPGPSAEAMGLGSEIVKAVGQGLKDFVDPITNAASDTVLRVIRRPLSERVAVFLGDIFVYLRFRETDGAQGTLKRIFEPIIKDLAAAAKLRTKEDPLIVVGHSLGGVILYDLLSDKAAVGKVEAASGTKLVVDAWITVGSQPSLFADMGLYAAPAAGGLLPRPAPVVNWLNVYDYTDVLSFVCQPLFKDVDDFEFDNVTSVIDAHSAYFQRPSFYSRLRKRLKQLNLLP